MRTLHISPVDTLFAGGRYPIEFMVYYQRPLPTAGIRLALKALSTAFWPMFGRYQLGILQESRYSEQLFYDEEQVNESFDPQAPIAEIFENNIGISSELEDRLFCLKIRHLKNGSILVPK